MVVVVCVDLYYCHCIHLEPKAIRHHINQSTVHISDVSDPDKIEALMVVFM